MAAARGDVLGISLDKLYAASKQGVVKQTKAIRNVLDILLTEARTIGLNPEQISKLCQIICSNSVGNPVRNIAIKCLLPARFVPVEAVITCFGWMNTPEATTNIISLLLRWMTVVFDMIDDVKPLTVVYSYLFFNLKNDVLRKHVYPLLQLMTKREDVVSHRVDRLLRLRSAIGNDPCINNMLALYKFYRPHLVSLRIKTSNIRLPANLYHYWTHYIRDIQQRNQNNSFNIVVLNSRSFWKDEDNMQIPEPAPSRKEKYSRNLPQLFDVESDEGKGKVPVHCLSSLQELMDVIDRVELPHQTLIALRYPVIQNLVSCFRDKTYIIRFHSSLEHILYWDFKEETDTSEDKSDSLILKHLILFTQYLKEGIPIVQEFLADYCNRYWNGYDFMDLFFKLISWFRLKSFESFQEILQPIKKMYYVYNARNKAGVIHYLCKLLENVIYLDMKRRNKDFISTLLNSTETSNCLYLFENEQEDFQPYETIYKLMIYVENLIVTGLTLENNNTVILHAAASFYKLVVEFCLKKDFPHLLLPLPAFVYGSFFTLDVTLFSQLCYILLKYREAIFKLKKQNLPKTFVSNFNLFIEDLMTSLWLQKAFDTSTQNSIFKISEETKDKLFSKELGNILSVYCHPAILPFAFTFDKTISPLPFMEKSVHQAFMDDSPLRQYFKYLTEVGLYNIPKFITAFALPK